MALLRSAFITLSHNRSLRGFFEHSPLGKRLNRRFIAGTTIEDAIAVAEAVNRQGIAVTLDSLGESVTSADEAYRAAEAYHQLLDAIATKRLNASVSLKLTQMGLQTKNADPAELTESILCNIVQHAQSAGNFVRVDMEDSRLTQVTLDIVRRVHARAGLRGAVGIVVQSYLYRSQADVEQLLADGIRIRLCKGAYDEPHEVAFPRKANVDANYLAIARMLLDSPLYHAFATHDEAIVTAIKAHAASLGIARDRFEFQMLFGVRRDLQRKLVAQGYKVRVYIPFGTEWYPYFMRRLAERPANVVFLARNLFRS